MGKSPDPECRWCHGTGEIHLVVTTVPCDCVKEKSQDTIELAEDSDDDLGSGSIGSDCHI